MRWGDTRQRFTRAGLSWDWGDVHVAAATAALQVPVFWAVRRVGAFDHHTYGMGWGGGLAVVFLLPAILLARVAARNARGPEWLWQLASSALLGVVWAAVFTGGGSFLVMFQLAGVAAAFGLLPLLGVACVRRRARIKGEEWGDLAVWLRSAGATVGLCSLVLVGAGVATAAGLIKEYEPPTLSAQQLTGVWRGDDGAVLNLRAGGRAELTELPAESDDADCKRYDATGTWTLETEGPEERDGVVVRPDGGCGQQAYWTIGGTEDDPELFVLFGDPDAGELWVLKRD